MELLNAVAESATTVSLFSFGRSHMCGGAGAAAAATPTPRTSALPTVAVQAKPAEPAGQTREAGRVSAEAVRPAAMAEPEPAFHPAPAPAPAPMAPEPAAQPMAHPSGQSSGQYSGQGDDSDAIFAKLEKLGDLRDKGILSDAEFAEKKMELLSRL